jgi:ABC-type transport system substrate-binding protein
MITVKRLICFTMVFLAGFSLLVGQNRGNNQEMSVEESYLQQSVELMIIREQSRAESRDMKLVALEYIGDAIDRGNTGEEVRSALEYLGLEGILNKTRENGRIINNYPDVRAKAAAYLGDLGTPEAKNTLVKICLADNEPMVLTEVVKSLAKIGLNDNGETVDAITWVVKRYNALNPDNLLALSALEAYEKLAESSGRIDAEAINTISAIATGPYIKPVQNRALQSLDILRQYAAQSQYNQSQGQQNTQNQSQTSGN